MEVILFNYNKGKLILKQNNKNIKYKLVQLYPINENEKVMIFKKYWLNVFKPIEYIDDFGNWMVDIRFSNYMKNIFFDFPFNEDKNYKVILFNNGQLYDYNYLISFIESKKLINLLYK